MGVLMECERCGQRKTGALLRGAFVCFACEEATRDQPPPGPFAVSYVNNQTGRVDYLLIEAATEEEVTRMLSEEYPLYGAKYATFKAAETPAWRGAWRRGDVRILKDRKLPAGVR